MTARHRLPNHVLKIIEAIEHDLAIIHRALRPLADGDHAGLNAEQIQLRALRASNAAHRIRESVAQISVAAAPPPPSAPTHANQ